MAKILYAEDNKDIRDTMASRLTEAGHEVVTAVNGLELLTRLREGAYDAVVTDNDMPGMSGLDALHDMRNNDRFKDIPVVMLSGNPNVRRPAESLGAVVVAKGTRGDVVEMLAAIGRLTSKS